MFPIIDFRNGRYQGQTSNQLPHGVGIFIDRNFMFCLAQWVSGEVKGRTIVIFPSGRIFCGTISYRKPEQLCTYELTEDHVQVITYAKPRQNSVQKLAAVMPLLQTILQIDNSSNEKQAHILQQYKYSNTNEQTNLLCMCKILNLDKNSTKLLYSHRNCVQFFQDYFLEVSPDIFQFLISENRNQKEYFIGLRGEGLGVKIEPVQQLGLHSKKTERVYLIRAMGFFTKENQMRDIGIKTLNNVMKGIIFEQGVYSLPETVIKYQPGKRPQNCFSNFHNYIKRSLFYRDKVLPTEYIYELDKFVAGFNKNLRKVQTERLAQYTIQNPNNDGNILEDIERKRQQKEKEKEAYKRTKEQPVEIPNPYNPTILKNNNPEFNLQRVKDQIYMSIDKKKGTTAKAAINHYHNVQYVDPDYRKLTRNQIEQRDLKSLTKYKPYNQDDHYQPPRPTKKQYQPTRDQQDQYYTPERTVPRKEDLYRSPYRYLDQIQDPPRPNRYDNRPTQYPLSDNYIPRDNSPPKYRRSPNRLEETSYAFPSKPRTYYPNSEKKSYLDETDYSDLANERGARAQPRYNYDYQNKKYPTEPFPYNRPSDKNRGRLLSHPLYE